METVEPRLLLTSVPFADPVILSVGPTPSTTDSRLLHLEDLDLDGDLDILTLNTVNAGFPSIEPGTYFTAWYLNSGDGTFGMQQREPSNRTDLWFSLADIDGDGDKDWLHSNGTWVENQFPTGGSFDFANVQTFDLGLDIRRIIDINGDNLDDFLVDTGWAENLGQGSFRVHPVEGGWGVPGSIISDVDADGDLDAFTKSGRRLLLHRNISTDNQFETVEVADWNFGNSDFSFRTTDFDRDGDDDIFLMSDSFAREGDQFTWVKMVLIENENGIFEQRTERTFTENVPSNPLDVYLEFDVTGDGHKELIFRNWAKDLGYYENLDSSTWTDLQLPDRHHVSTQPDNQGDIDGDGDTDLVSYWFNRTNLANELHWLDGIDPASEGQLIAEGVRNKNFNQLVPTATDFDNDGDTDLIFNRSNNVSWIENLGNSEFVAEREVVGAFGVHTVSDISGDGLPDILVSDVDRLGTPVNVWHRNLGGGQVSAEILLPADKSVVLLDVDGDGDPDLHSHQQGQGSVRLNDGDGTFGERISVPGEQLTASDVDLDGDLDLISSGSTELVWYENLGGQNYGPATAITSSENAIAPTVVAADFDGDGDDDLVAVQASTSRVFENKNGEFIEASKFDGNRLNLGNVELVDMDGDGDLDLTGRGPEGMSLHENLGDLRFEASQLLFRDRPSSWFYAMTDLNQDGLVDFVTANGLRMNWHRNTSETDRDVVTGIDIDRITREIRGGESSPQNDWNGDGVVTEADIDFLLAEAGSIRGDVNLDGEVGFVDFLALSGNFGKQEATWLDGDVDGDGLVSFADFLLLSAVFGWRS